MTCAALKPSPLAAAQLAALRDCDPTLRRIPRGWVRSPNSADAPPHSAFVVRGLLESGHLEMGGTGWARLTPKGRQAIGGQP